MSDTIDGTQLTDITIDGVSVSEVTVDGDVVWPNSGGTTTSQLTSIADHIWPMGEGSGTTVGDDVGTIDGTISGSSWVTGSGGKEGAFLRQDATGEIVEFGTGVFDTQTAFTVCAWGYWTGTLANGDYLFQQNTTDVLFQVTSTGTMEAWVRGDGNSSLYSATEGWYMAAITYAGGTATVYVYELGNGQVVNNSWSATDPAWNGEFAMGNRPGGDRTWARDFDFGLVAYQEATEAEIQDHYDQTKSLY